MDKDLNALKRISEYSQYTGYKKDAGLKTTKMNAYLKMQELRKESAKYAVSDSEKAAAIDDKFGALL